MKTTFKMGICLMLLSFAISSCMKEELKFQPDDNIYYSTEIFNPTHMQIYGSWQLSEVSDRYGAIGRDFDFQTVEITPIGRFMFKMNGELVSSGKIIVDRQEDDVLLVSFYSDATNTDIQKHIEFINSETMFLRAPCCDGKDYTLSRVNLE